MRRITLGNSKWRVSSDLRDCIVPDKLGNFDPFGPIVLSVIDVGSKVLIDLAVQLFRLSIGLGVEHIGHLPFNAQLRRPKVGTKDKPPHRGSEEKGRDRTRLA